MPTVSSVVLFPSQKPSSFSLVRIGLLPKTRARRRTVIFPFSLKTLDRVGRLTFIRVRSCAANESKEDPNQKAQSDEEVRDLGVRAALSMLKFYKREISPLLPSSCRYVPTCSEYSMEAYKKYGVVKGTILTAWRLCRCNPLGGYGFDPPRWFDEESPSDHP